ncbi:MAG: sulfatase activating formylglycine-generating enzyme [Candidatus Azotimanducaceae bacterium]|jgi:formylglycine-generating enzyme required for sulfatase activity
MNEQNNIIEALPFERAASGPVKTRFSVNPLSTGIIVFFLLLLCAATFMFMAKAIRITTEPVSESFQFTSGFQYQIGERYLMLSGGYTFIASKPGYEPFLGEINVGKEADQDFNFFLVKLPGILDIKTEPDSNSEIYIDQELKGNSPLRLKSILAGTHDVSIRSKRFLDYDTEILIEGMRTEQQLIASLVPAWANIQISSQPSADIIIDGKKVSRSPALVEIIQGERLIKIQQKGYKTWEGNIDVVAGVDQTLDLLVLEKSDGKVAINTTPSGANVNINGKYRGQTPIQLTLAPGNDYRVRLSKAGYEPATRSINLAPDEDTSLDQKMKPILGSVQVMVEPSGAKLFVDGKSMGNANQQLLLNVSKHKIEVRLAGYATYITEVMPRPGSNQQLAIKLQTEDEARIAAIPTVIRTSAGPVLNLIIPGKLSMGAGRREPGRRSNEIVKDVELTRAYYLATTEITNAEYKVFNPGHDSGVIGRALLSEDGRPAVNITWERAAAYCNWLSEQEGLPAAYEFVDGQLAAVKPLNTGYRLPTEAEWAWASRYAAGPTPTRFPWGNNMPPVEVLANYADESATSMVPYHIGGYNDGYRGPSPADIFPANEFGIHDLAGNVAEWIHDNYSVKIPREKLIDPSGPETGDYHVIRGSSYQHGRFSELRWTYRDYGDVARYDVGFRVARYLE